MAESDAIVLPLGSGIELQATGVRRDREGSLVADVAVLNGQPLWGRSVTLSAQKDRLQAATEAAAVPGVAPVTTAQLEHALLDLLTKAPALLQSHTGPSQAETLVTLAEKSEGGEMTEFWHNHGEPWVTYHVNDHWENWPVQSGRVTRWLIGRYYFHCGKPPSKDALAGALAVLEARAIYDGPEYTIHTRLAQSGELIYLDLADVSWGAVEIDRHGWQVIERPPVKFRRARGMLPLPEPVMGGSLDRLWTYMNVVDPKDRILLKAWLVAILRPTGPYAVLAISGEQGSGKSTMARVLRNIVDPNVAPLRAPPHKDLDIAITAQNSWCSAFDNLSRIDPWFADAICRLATGGGHATRKLWTDSDETLFDSQRPVILNSIEDLATRADLLDRSLVITPPPLTKGKRKSEAALWDSFEKDHPLILGALLTAVSVALMNVAKVRTTNLPRMADFATWALAAAPALGYTSRDFLAAYNGNRRDANSLALESSPITGPLRRLLNKHNPFEGTCKSLLEQLDDTRSDSERKSKTWPSSPRALTGALKRITPNLREEGIGVEELGRKGDGYRLRITKLPSRRSQRSQVHSGAQSKRA